jgi:hypothetical protein
MPTVPQRARLRPGEAWRALGAPVAVTCQDPGIPCGREAQKRTAIAAVAACLAAHPPAGHVLYAEDDALPAMALPGLLGDLAATGQVITLWTSAYTFLPAALRRTLIEGGPLPARLLEPVRGLRGWFGSVALLLPRDAAEAVTAWESDDAGFDIHLRSWLLATGTPLLAAVPSLAQHRDDIPRIATRGGPAVVQSWTFGWPVASALPASAGEVLEVLPRRMPGWPAWRVALHLPGRDRRAVRAALDALERAGKALAVPRRQAVLYCRCDTAPPAAAPGLREGAC